MKKLLALRRALLLTLVWGLAACGGGGGDSGSTVTPPPPPPVSVDSPLDDPAVYSAADAASLPGATEEAAVTHHRITLSGTAISYTATTGHLIARRPADSAAQASMFYVAYTADGAAAGTRPVTFFYNGGPGSATVWLHLGSFGPKRLVTGVPATTAATPFPLVDNNESLLDTSDLVFVNAVGTGYSQAIAPFTNRSFYGVDVDAALFRDFVQRWLAVNQRQASPKFLFGESYGGPRTAVLVRLLQAAGTAIDGVVLQSPALDYNSNCGVLGRPGQSCQAYLPTYASTAAFHRLARPAPGDLTAFLSDVRSFTAQRYAPAVTAYFGGQAPAADLLASLAGYSGIAAGVWRDDFNFPPWHFQSVLLPGQLTGRYDARMAAPQGSALAGEGDPSSTFISPSFATGIAGYLRDTLRYTNRSTYVLLSNAIQNWDFSHSGRAYPDTVPDLAAALAQNPRLRVLAVSGTNDLATPFYLTEQDLARLGADARVAVRNYPGGHMSYLDDTTRPLQKADLVAFIRQAAATRTAQAATALQRSAAVRPDRAGTPATQPLPAPLEPAFQAPMREPWVPPPR